LEALIQAFRAEIALARQSQLRVEDKSPVGTGRQALLATITLPLVNEDNAVGAFAYGLGWAGVQARRLFALHAGHGRESHAELRVFACRRVFVRAADGLHPDP